MSLVTSSNPAIAADTMAGFITPDDLARRLRVSPRTLARWHAARKGPPRCVVGKLILYRSEAVRDWLAGLERDPRASDRRRR